MKKEEDDLLKNIRKLVSLICNSKPETTIKGEIESLAFLIGHDPIVINDSKCYFTIDEDNPIGSIFNKDDNIFICQNCGAKHELGNYEIVKKRK